MGETYSRSLTVSKGSGGEQVQRVLLRGAERFEDALAPLDGVAEAVAAVATVLTPGEFDLVAAGPVGPCEGVGGREVMPIRREALGLDAETVQTQTTRR